MTLDELSEIPAVLKEIVWSYLEPYDTHDLKLMLAIHAGKIITKYFQKMGGDEWIKHYGSAKEVIAII